MHGMPDRWFLGQAASIWDSKTTAGACFYGEPTKDFEKIIYNFGSM